MAFNVKEFLEKNKAAFGSDAEFSEAVQWVDEREKGNMRQSDYNRHMNQLAEDRKKFQTEYDANEAYRQQLEAAEQQLIAARQQMAQQGGAGQNPIIVKEIADLKATIATLQETFTAREQQHNASLARTVEIATKIPEYSRRFEERYKRPFEVKKFDEFYGQDDIRGMSFDRAFQLFTFEDEQRMREADTKAQLEAAKAEGIKIGRSTQSAPQDAQPRGYSPLSGSRIQPPSQQQQAGQPAGQQQQQQQQTPALPEAGSMEVRSKVNDAFATRLAQP